MYIVFWASQLALLVKNFLASAGDVRDASLIPGSGISPGGGHGNPLQYSGLENLMDGGAWRATFHGRRKESDMTERLSIAQHRHFCLDNPKDRGA